MELKDAALDFMINAKETTIRLYDHVSNQTVVEITLTPEGLSQAMSRLSMTKCKAIVNEYSFSKLNKKMENKYLEFEINKDLRRGDEQELHALAQSNCPDGWTPDKYYGSQNSFFTKEGKTYARAVIRRWID